MKPAIVAESDVSVIGRKRLRVAATIPNSNNPLTPTGIEALLRKQADTILNRFRGPNAVVIFCYFEGDDLDQAYTVASLFASKDGKKWNGDPAPQKRWSELRIR